MTSTPVASGTFTTSTGQTQQQSQQQNVALVQHSSHSQHQQQQSQAASVVSTESFVQATQSQAVPNQTQRKQNEVLQNLLNPGRKINIVSNNGGGNGGATATFRTNAAGNLIALNLNQQPNHPQQQQNHHHQQQIHLHQQNAQTQQHQPEQQTTVRVSMSALASQLASPPAIMTNSTSFGGYTLSTVSGAGSSGGSIKILNSSIQQQRVLANSLRRDSLSSTSQGPPNAIVVGVAAPSPGSDSNASNASGFAVPQATSSSAVNSSNSSTLNALLANATTPSPSGSEHSQSSQNQSQSLLERLNSGAVSTNVALSNMSPQQHLASTTQAQYITKTLAQSPATSSIHSPMSSPHPQPSPSPHLPPPQHQQPTQQQQNQTQTATLNLQGINFSTLQGAMANFPGLQNVQVQIPGFNQPISLQLTGGSLHAVQQSSQSGNPTVSVVATGGNTANSSNLNCGQQSHQQQRSLLVSVPVSSANQQQCQPQHTITLQPQQLQHHNQSSSGTVVNLPPNAVTSGGTQTVVLANNSPAVVPSTSMPNNAPSNSSNSGTTMLTLPIGK